MGKSAGDSAAQPENADHAFGRPVKGGPGRFVVSDEDLERFLSAVVTASWSAPTYPRTWRPASEQHQEIWRRLVS